METQDEPLNDPTESAIHRASGRKQRTSNQVDDRAMSERSMFDRDATEQRELSDGERIELFRESLAQSVLPDLPHIPGYHTAWLTTTNPRDSIQWRRRIGYELIRVEDCPGWDGITLKSGDYAGCIVVNEMIAARIPLALYNSYMAEVHHNLPLAEEEKLSASVESLSEQAAAAGSKVVVGDGTASLVQRATPMPRFSV